MNLKLSRIQKVPNFVFNKTVYRGSHSSLSEIIPEAQRLLSWVDILEVAMKSRKEGFDEVTGNAN